MFWGDIALDEEDLRMFQIDRTIDLTQSAPQTATNVDALPLHQVAWNPMQNNCLPKTVQTSVQSLPSIEAMLSSVRVRE